MTDKFRRGPGDSLDQLRTIDHSAKRATGAGNPGRARDSLDIGETGGIPERPTTDGYPPGKVIAGRYRVEALLGEGGMGEVYRVHDEEAREVRALKTIRGEWLASEVAQRRFREEATLSQKLRHPNIVETYDIGSDEGVRFYTMELVTGGSLRDTLEERRASGKAFSREEAIGLVGDLLTALSYAHSRTVHRDIKPENILLTPDGRPKLADFGLAKLVETEHRASEGNRVGTAYYMAPEQLRGDGTVDARADLYSVGVVLYELLTGEVPQGAVERPSAFRRDLPGWLDDVVMRSIAPKPDARFANADEFLKALRRESAAARSAVPVTRKAVAIRVMLLIGLAAAGVGFVAMRGHVPKPSESSRRGVSEPEPLRAPEVATLPAADPKLVAVGYLTASQDALPAEDPAVASVVGAVTDALRAAALNVVESAPAGDRAEILESARRAGAGKLVVAKVQVQDVAKGGHHAASVQITLEAKETSTTASLGSVQASGMAISPAGPSAAGWGDAIRTATSYALKDVQLQSQLAAKLVPTP